MIFKGLENYLVNNSPTEVIIEGLICLLFFIATMILVAKCAKNRRVVLILSAVYVLIVVAALFGFKILSIELAFLFAILIGSVVVLYGKNLRKTFESSLIGLRSGTYISLDEKEQLINTLVNTCEYLSKHKVGALIAIEREDSLNSIIEKSISINGNVTEELLTTIFTVGTACHDGAVIIQGNKLMCAAAYLPSTDKYDLPKSLGTRHRAAIGMSERYDAFTLVVSEETGAISYTIDGNIFQNVDKEKIREELNTYIRIN